MATFTVPVPATVVMISHAQPADKSEELPTYSSWRETTTFRVLDLVCASSAVGHSNAKLAIATGLPFEQVDVEKADNHLMQGDRVAIGLNRGGKSINWQFCGYVLTDQLSIDVRAERRIWKVVGPEWWWGDGNPSTGAGLAVKGQCRRMASGDDEWQKSTGSVTAYKDWDIFTDERAIFNPDGKRNMTRDEVILTAPKRKPKYNGNIWEASDRRIASVNVAEHWNMRAAAKAVVEVFGDLDFSGIAPPDWAETIMELTDKMRETDVEGVGVFEALRRILGNKYRFWIDPFPSKPGGELVDISGKDWGPFQLHFYKVGEGDSANIVLNPRGTSMEKAKASVTRIELARDISKAPNLIQVNGSYARAIKLVYWGGRTKNLTEPQKKTALQHAWNKDDAKLGDWDKNDVLDIAFADLTKEKRSEWISKYTTPGKEFLKYWQIFRRFVWNEANELDTTKKAIYGTTDEVAHWSPNLEGIADNPDFPKLWFRRRRKMLDTPYLRNEKSSQWEKHPPTLWMAIAPTANDSDWTKLQWRKISDQYFNFDNDRCALTITVDDIREWKPFDKSDTPDEAEADQWPNDPSTFATLLHNGRLRMAVECSITTDNAMECVAKPTKAAGAPFPRQVLVNAQKNFVSLLSYNDSLATPSGLTPYVLDMKADAQRQADLTRDAAQDEQIHASVVTSGDWPRQSIGSIISETGGRQINLAGKSGRGAQIVAVRLDMRSFNYEYLTESLALALGEKDRRLLENRAKVFKDAKRPTKFSD